MRSRAGVDAFACNSSSGSPLGYTSGEHIGHARYRAGATGTHFDFDIRAEGIMLHVQHRYRWLTAVVLSMLLSAPLTAEEADQAVNDTAFLSVITLERQQRESVNKRIPVDLRVRARCIAVFPSVVKAGLIVAAQHGNGLVSCRQPDSGIWGTPGVVSITAASVGIQAGIQDASYILLFMDESAVAELFDSRLSFGNEVSIAAGPVGAAASYTDMPSVISYVRTSGLFAGVDLGGARISFSDDANTDLYGEDATAQSILFGELPLPLALQPFHSALKSFAPEL